MRMRGILLIGITVERIRTSNKMAVNHITVRLMNCCGWAELSGIQSYTSKDLNKVIQGVRSISKGALVFSSACRHETPKTCGSIRLAKDVEKHKLGTTTALPPFRNPNTGRIIVPFLWKLDRDAIYAYCKANNVTAVTYPSW